MSKKLTEQERTINRQNAACNLVAKKSIRQAFKDDKDNFYTFDSTYVALRVPQVDANAKLKRLIAAGRINQSLAIKAERHCLSSLRLYDEGKEELEVEEPEYDFEEPESETDEPEIEIEESESESDEPDVEIEESEAEEPEVEILSDSEESPEIEISLD